MKVLNERISKWAHLSFYHKWFSRYMHLKFEKEVTFIGRFSPYEIPESGDKISNFYFVDQNKNTKIKKKNLKFVCLINHVN